MGLHSKSEMTFKTLSYVASGIAQSKKVRLQVLGRGICSKSLLLNKSASSRLGH